MASYTLDEARTLRKAISEAIVKLDEVRFRASCNTEAYRVAVATITTLNHEAETLDDTIRKLSATGDAETVRRIANGWDFWEVVRNADWNGDHDYRRIAREWSEVFTAAGLAELRDTWRAVRRKLSAAARAAGLNVCCDRWDDIIADTIGAGREAYNRALADPEILVKRLESGAHVPESFAYCFQ